MFQYIDVLFNLEAVDTTYAKPKIFSRYFQSQNPDLFWFASATSYLNPKFRKRPTNRALKHVLRVFSAPPIYINV